MPLVARTLVGLAGLVAAASMSYADQGAASAAQPAAPPAPQAAVSRDVSGRMTLRAIRLEAPLRIDGRLDEAIYQDIAPVSDFIQIEPREGEAATEKTDVWIAFDDDNFYVSFRNWETEPDRVVAKEMRRDHSSIWGGDDIVAFLIDTFHDGRNGFEFTLNAIGGRQDAQMANEQQWIGDWNTIWDFSVGRFEGGWTVETAIPFKSLRYRPGENQTWGFNALRTNRWKNELSFLAPTPKARGQRGLHQASLAATLVGVAAPPGSKNLEIKPYLISNASSVRTDGPGLTHDVTGDIGLDAKYGVTQNLTADLTFNTDFAQVEADQQQVNLTRFSLFFPEKREFFLENQGTFAFGSTGGRGGDTPILFYSRRIGLERGRVVPIDGGGRLTGRLGRYSLGLLNIQTGDEPAAQAAATNFSVVRLRRDILRRSSVGLLFTGRNGQGGAGDNVAYGIDGTFAFFANLAINTYWAKTETKGASGRDTSYRAQFDYAGDRYGLQLEHLMVGDAFNPGVGFVRRTDMRKTFGQARFSPRPRASEVVRRFSFSGSVGYVENGAGRVEARERDGEFAIEFQSGDRFSAGYGGTYEFLPSPFRIATGVTLPVGGYSFDSVRMGYSRATQQRISGTLSAEHGTFYNGHRTTVGLSGGRVNLTPQISVEPSYSVNRVDLVQGSFTTHLSGTRVSLTPTARMFLSAFLQYDSSNNAMASNVRLRLEYRPGSELFVVLNEDRDTRGRSFPDLANRAFIVKVNRLLRF
ncbi:MAG: carbohydrate binding family 9 domain-containing protein [Acidobacteria bacterium]|nr:carbohydrate binding family 9 domain-containing protein [Acidobacteriota bacterium]